MGIRSVGTFPFGSCNILASWFSAMGLRSAYATSAPEFVLCAGSHIFLPPAPGSTVDSMRYLRRYTGLTNEDTHPGYPQAIRI